MNAEAPDILYIHGPNGLGSSVLASHLVAELQTVTNATVLTFAFDKLDILTQSPSTFYLSMIRQLLFTRPPLFRLVSSVAEWMKEEDVFGYEILTGLFLTLLKGSYPNPVFCVVHASDDCKGYEFDNIVQVLRRYRAMSDGIFKLAVLEEHPRAGLFLDESARCRDIELSDASLHAPGIQSFVNDRVNRLAIRRPEWNGYKQDLIDKLCDGSGSDNGAATFLRASYATQLVEIAKVSSTAGSVRKLINGLPPTMNDLYKVAYDQLEASLRIPLLPLLQWVWHSARPLTRRELAVVAGLITATDRGLTTWEDLKLNTPQRIAQDIRPLKGVLLRVSGMIVRPIHSTLGAFLAEKWHQTGGDAEVAVFNQCLDYLELVLQNIPSLNEAEDDLASDALAVRDMGSRELSLLGFAVAYWHIHYRRVRDRPVCDGRSRVLRLLGSERNCGLLFQLHQAYIGKQSKRFPAFDTPLKIASRFGLVDIVKSVMPAIGSRHAGKRALGDALDLAAGYDHLEVVELLLQHGAPCHNALALASKNGSGATGGSSKIVSKILEAHPEAINRKDDLGRAPFLLAALNGNETIAEYLLKRGADGNITTNGRTAVHVAAKTGQSKVLGLVNGNIDIQAVDGFGNDALLMAAEGGFDDVVKILLSRGVATNRQNQDGFTALHRATALGHASTCDILLKGVDDVLIESKTGFSPVHLAAQEGHLGILQKLIGMLERADVCQKGHRAAGPPHGGNVEEATGPCGVARPPLELAALEGHVGVVRELLKYPRYSDEPTRATAFLLAAAQGWDGVVAELLKSGFTTVVYDKNGEDALHLAARFQHPHVVTQILDSEFKSSELFGIISETDNDLGYTVLHIAARIGRILTVRELLRRSASPRRAARHGETSVHVAAECGHVSVTEELLRASGEGPWQGCVLLVTDVKGHTPLTRAVQGGHLGVARTILQFAKAMLKSNSQQSWAAQARLTDLQAEKDALYLAVEAQSEELVTLLLDHEWNINANNKTGPNGLHFASGSAIHRKDCSMLALLLSKGADPNVKYPYDELMTAQKQGDRPLHIAVEAHRIDALRILLERGAGVNEKNDQGITPLWRAAYSGWVDGVQELLRWNPDLEASKSDTLWTPLHSAFDNAEITRMLLGAGANPLAISRDGRPPFFFAADETGGDDTLRVYLDADVDPNWHHPKTGDTMLHHAVVGGTVPTLELLIQRGADINAANELCRWSTPVHEALAAGPLENARFLLQQKVSKIDFSADSERLGTLLMAAARRADGPDAMLLLLEDRDIDINGRSKRCDRFFSALQIAANRGSEETVVALLAAGANPNHVGGGLFGSPLLAAIMSSPEDRRVRVAKMLLEAGSDANYAGSTNGTALEWALSHDRGDAVKLLLTGEPPFRNTSRDPGHDKTNAASESDSMSRTKYKVNVNAISVNPRLGTPLLAAVDSGSPHIQSLLDLGADPNLPRKPFETETPAQVAVRRGRLDVLKTLVKAGADLKYIGPLKRRVLSHAIGWKSHEILSYLWEHAQSHKGIVDINERDVELQTPLMIAAREGSISVVRDLVDRGADVDARDRSGMSAVMHAARKDYAEIVDVLLSRGNADVHLTDDKGRDALYWAARCAGTQIFRTIWKNVNRENARVYEEASFAAVASGRYDLFEKLLKGLQYLVKGPRLDRDGWTVLFTAEMYRREDWEEAFERISTEKVKAEPKLPKGWDRNLPVCVTVDEEGGNVLTVGSRCSSSARRVPLLFTAL